MQGLETIVVGAGFAGAIAARELAENGAHVLLLEKQKHIGGGAFDEKDEHGVLIHKFGPHIFHTGDEKIFRWLSRFTKWNGYEHRVMAKLEGGLVPVPFNLNSLYEVYGKEKAAELEKKLVEAFGRERKISISELRKSSEPELLALADFIYENIFLHYTEKQWGKSPENVSEETLARVPVFISRDNRYFQDIFQGIPAEGYTELFKKILSHPNIELYTETEAASVLDFSEGEIYAFGKPFSGKVIYTGAADELFSCRFGRLPYRTLDFSFEHYEKEFFQPCGTINYTVGESFTRITEFKHLTGQKTGNSTTIVKEFPKDYSGAVGETPFYPVNSPESAALYEKYAALATGYKNLFLLGRLAEFKYSNMDTVAANSLALAQKIISENLKGNNEK